MIWFDFLIFQIQNGATFVAVDKISNPRDESPALLIQGIVLCCFYENLVLNVVHSCRYYVSMHVRINIMLDIALYFAWLMFTASLQLDDGGGMDPQAMRRCMSFGFSDKKSKSAIGQCMDSINSCFILLCFPLFKLLVDF